MRQPAAAIRAAPDGSTTRKSTAHAVLRQEATRNERGYRTSSPRASFPRSGVSGRSPAGTIKPNELGISTTVQPPWSPALNLLTTLCQSCEILVSQRARSSPFSHLRLVLSCYPPGVHHNYGSYAAFRSLPALSLIGCSSRAGKNNVAAENFLPRFPLRDCYFCVCVNFDPAFAQSPIGNSQRSCGY